jgi:quercetin dioxygenase-like cupin family protein
MVIRAIDPSGGIATLEGRVGRLLRGEGCSVQFLELPAGLYMFEHAHPWESVVYTVRGRWVLCSGGEREVIEAGTITWFKPGLSKGFEVPFAVPALLLIFRPVTDMLDDEEYRMYWEAMAAKMEGMREQGTAFRIDALPEGHPARAYAKALI